MLNSQTLSFTKIIQRKKTDSSFYSEGEMPMILELFVWLILYAILQCILFFVTHLLELFESKDEYTKSELTDLRSILLSGLSRIVPNGMAAVAMLVGIIASWLLVLFGGLMSPDTTPATDHAESAWPNYFFLSFLTVIIFHIAMPALKDLNLGRSSALSRFASEDKSLLVSVAVNLVAISLAGWGVFHELSFLFCLLNGLLCMSYCLYLLRKKIAGTEQSTAEQPADNDPIEP